MIIYAYISSSLVIRTFILYNMEIVNVIAVCKKKLFLLNVYTKVIKILITKKIRFVRKEKYFLI
jgi:hypothetical protein